MDWADYISTNVPFPFSSGWHEIIFVTPVIIFLLGLSLFVRRRQRDENMMGYTDVKIPWETRFSEADRAIREVIESFPQEIRKEADRVSYLLEKWPEEPRRGFHLLGQFKGFERSMVSSAGGPIFIFVGPHHVYCEEEGIDFTEEIRRTYLHELGHHLGLEESDLEERGL